MKALVISEPEGFFKIIGVEEFLDEPLVRRKCTAGADYAPSHHHQVQLFLGPIGCDVGVFFEGVVAVERLIPHWIGRYPPSQKIANALEQVIRRVPMIIENVAADMA